MPEPTASSPGSALVRCAACQTLNRVELARFDHGPKCARCRQPLPLGRPNAVTDADFPTITAGASVPVLVDFHADWCGPCHAMAPTLDDFASRRARDVLVLKLDTDANQQTAQRFGIRGIPTLIVFRAGQEVRRHVGMADLHTLEALVS